MEPNKWWDHSGEPGEFTVADLKRFEAVCAKVGRDQRECERQVMEYRFWGPEGAPR